MWYTNPAHRGDDAEEQERKRREKEREKERRRERDRQRKAEDEAEDAADGWTKVTGGLPGQQQVAAFTFLDSIHKSSWTRMKFHVALLG